MMHYRKRIVLIRAVVAYLVANFRLLMLGLCEMIIAETEDRDITVLLRS